MPAAMIKRNATNEIGGKSASPSFIASHVELQITQSVSHAPTTFKEQRAFVLSLRGRVDEVISIW